MIIQLEIRNVELNHIPFFSLCQNSKDKNLKKTDVSMCIYFKGNIDASLHSLLIPN